MKTRTIVTWITVLTITASTCLPFSAFAEGEETTAAPAITEAPNIAEDASATTAAPFTSTAKATIANKKGSVSLETTLEENDEADHDKYLSDDATITPTGSTSAAATDGVKQDGTTFRKMETNPGATEVTLVETIATTAATKKAFNPFDTIYEFRDPNQVHIIDSAVKNVPYSFLLFPEKTTPVNTETNATANTATETTTESTTMTTATTISTQSPVIPSDAEPIPSDLKIDGKGSEGNFTVLYYSDNSLIVDGELDYSGPSVKIPASINGKKVRTVCIGTESQLGYGWQKKSEICIPSGVGVSVSDNKVANFTNVSYQEAARILSAHGVTLKVEDTIVTGLSISDGGNVTANGGGDWFYDDAPATTAVAAVRNADIDRPSIYYRLPEGLKYYDETSEVYGVPKETGTFIFTVEKGEYIYTYSLTVNENSNMNVYNETDDGYIIMDAIGTDVGGHDYVLSAPVESLFRSKGEFDQFVALWLNGERLELGKDYDAVEGSTKMTIFAQTFENKAKMNGVNTIAAEFRITDPKKLNDSKDTNPLRVTSQNFRFDNGTPVKINYSRTVGETMPYVAPAPAPVNAANVSPVNNTSSNTTTTTTTTVSDAGTGSAVVTGDSRPYWLYVSASVAGLLGIFTTFPRRKRKTGEEQ